MKNSLQQHQCLCSIVFSEGLLAETTLPAQTLMLKRALFSRVESELAIVQSDVNSGENEVASDILEITWDGVKGGLAFLFELKSFFRSTQILNSLGMDGSGRWSWPERDIDTLAATVTLLRVRS